MFRLFHQFLGRRESSPAVASPPPEPPTPKQYLLHPSIVGIPEGIYRLVYENEYCNSKSGVCLSTSLELAVYGQDLDYTLVVPLSRGSKKDKDGEWELQYIPNIQEATVWNCPISEITPGSIAEPFFEEMHQRQKQLDRRLFSYCERRPEDRPTLWYETDLEKVVWQRYTEIQKGRIEIPGPDTTRGMIGQRWN